MGHTHTALGVEKVRLENLLSKSAWEEFCQAYPDKIALMRQYRQATGREAYELFNRADVQEMRRRFQTEHPEAYTIYVRMGFERKNLNGDALTSPGQRWWLEETDEDKETKSKK